MSTKAEQKVIKLAFRIFLKFIFCSDFRQYFIIFYIQTQNVIIIIIMLFDGTYWGHWIINAPV
jgi:hypothetical protein